MSGGPVLLSPRRFEDQRGWFSETFNAQRAASAGVTAEFCQDNQSFSRESGTLRGLHFQAPPFAQAKLVRCLRGSILDVIVDIRRDSPTFGKWASAVLSTANGLQLFVPRGYAHAFLTLEADCEIAYKVDNHYSAEADGGVAWNDPSIGIDWGQLQSGPVLSAKDAELPMLADVIIDFPYDGVPLGDLMTVAV